MICPLMDSIVAQLRKNNNPKCDDDDDDDEEKTGVTGRGPGLFYEGSFANLFGVAYLVEMILLDRQGRRPLRKDGSFGDWGRNYKFKSNAGKIRRVEEKWRLLNGEE
jgi:hypothetical protein